MSRPMRTAAALTFVALFGAAMVASSGVVAAKHARTQHWIVTDTLTCRNELSPVAGALSCDAWGPVRGIDDRLDVYSSRLGRFYFTERTRYWQSVVGRPLPRCDTQVLMGSERLHAVIRDRVKAADWSCIATARGRGLIKQNAHGVADFWVQRETVMFTGQHERVIVVNPQRAGGYPVDLGIPTLPGHYNAQQWLHAEHEWHIRVPPNYAYRLVIKVLPTIVVE